MVRTVLVATALVVATFLLGGCGGQEIPGYSADEVIEHFKARASVQLLEFEPSPGTAPGWAPADLSPYTFGNETPTGAESRLLRTYGHFTIYVLDERRDLAYELRRRGATFVTRGRTRWTRAKEGEAVAGPSWFALRVYGNLLVLYEAGKMRRLDSRFRRLEAVIRGFPPAKS